MSQRGLKRVSTSVLRDLHEAIAADRLRPMIDRAALVAFGVQHQLDPITAVLAGHGKAACVAILEVILAERENPRPTPELVWTGPEGATATARDTVVVLRALFESARENVVLAGYSFDHARDVLAALHDSMVKHGVVSTFFVDIPQIERGVAVDAHLQKHLGGFFATNWPFGEPRPRLYYDVRSISPGPPWSSLHAKCVVVDGARAFVSSANFTQRAQERNIEVGVLIDDAGFAGSLANQWMGLADARLAVEWRPTASPPP